MSLGSFLSACFTNLINLIGNIGIKLINLLKQIFSALGLGEFTQTIWNLISKFNIFGVFKEEISTLYSWIPCPELISALSFFFAFSCALGAFKLLKKIIPFI